MDGNAKPPKPSLNRSSSRVKQLYHRIFRSSSAGTLKHTRSIREAEPAPSPLVVPLVSSPDGAPTGGSKPEPAPPAIPPHHKATADDSKGAASAHAHHGKPPGEKPKPRAASSSKWNILRPVKNLVKAYVKFMMAPIPGEGGMPAGGGAEGYMSVTASTPRHSLADRDRIYLEALRKERDWAGGGQHLSRGSTPGGGGGGSSRPHLRATRSGPLPARSYGYRSSGRRYAVSGPLPTSLSREDSRRYSGELSKQGELRRRTSDELARDAVVGPMVVFGPGDPAPPPHAEQQVVVPLAEVEEVTEIEEEREDEDAFDQVPPVYSYKQQAAAHPRLSAVAEEAGTPRGVTLR